MAVTTGQVIEFVQQFAAVVEENRKFLIDLDRAIGDADHGENLHRGFAAVLERLDGVEDGPPADVLKTVAMTLVSKVGGAAGPLYGTAFLRASAAIGGRDELTTDDVVGALEASLEGVKTRGKAEVGDKTMVDAWQPAVEAARDAAAAGGDLSAVFVEAAAAAKEGMERATPLVARKGRASYLGERSADHQDPGATSTWLLFDTLARCTRGEGASHG
jgi:phosphoenolpyruvate---glycerone phosphotransferase subunit DhaL